MDFVVSRLILKIKMSVNICCRVFSYTVSFYFWTFEYNFFRFFLKILDIYCYKNRANGKFIIYVLQTKDNNTKKRMKQKKIYFY